MPSLSNASLDLLRASTQLGPAVDAIQVALQANALDWNDALYFADGQGLTPLLRNVWKGAGLNRLIPDSARERIEQAYRDNATRNADARRDFAEIMALMARSGVETIVLKGLPVLDALYDDPAERVLYDFDLLARNQGEAQRGYDALAAAGFTPVPTKAGALVTKHLPSLWRLDGFVRRGYLFDVAQPRPVELHLTLWDENWRGLTIRNLAELWKRSRTLTRRSDMKEKVSEVSVLSDEDTMIHLAMHFSTHLVEREARVGQLLDVARMVLRRGAQLDWDYIVRASEETYTARFIYLALTMAHTAVGAPLPPEKTHSALRAQTPSKLRTYVEREATDDLFAMDYRAPDLSRAYALTFAASASLGEKMGVLHYALMPPREALAEKYHAPRDAAPLPLYARHVAERGREYINARRHSVRAD